MSDKTFLYAALSEFSYSRAINDHRIDLENLVSDRKVVE